MKELEQKQIVEQSETQIETSENPAPSQSEIEPAPHSGEISQWMKIVVQLRRIGLFLQVIALLGGYTLLVPLFRNRALLTSTTFTHSTLLIISMLVSILLSFLTAIASRTKLHSAYLVSNLLSIVGVVSVIAFTILIRNRGKLDSDAFPELFFHILKQGGTGMKSLHKFQQSSECCGIQLPRTTHWRQSPSPSPWSSWYYRTLLSKDYIEEARRLFTLPWSCCSSSTLECEHLAFERVSVSTVDKYLVEEELFGLERKLKKKLSQSARDSVFDKACQLSPILEPKSIFVVSGVFVIVSLINIVSDGVMKVNSMRMGKR